MRVISLDSIEPGFLSARPILDKDGRVLLQQNVVLTEEYIAALRARGYDAVYIRDPDIAVEVPPEEDITPATRARALQSLRAVCEDIKAQIGAVKAQNRNELEKALESDAIRHIISKRGVLSRVHDVIGSILEQALSRQTLAGLSSIRSHDVKLFEHSIDVCIVCIMIGRTVGLDQHRLRQLATGALLHDIGKVFIDATADRERDIRQHTRLGYDLLKNGEDPDILAPHVALEHHEHQDGSGLPRGTVSGNAVERDRNLPPPIPTLVGEICAIANFYDNALNGIDVPEPLSVDQAIKRVRAAAGSKLNNAIVQAFLRVVPVYPVGSEVTLTGKQYNHFRAIVSAVNPGALDRPRVLIVRNPAGTPLPFPVEVDLSRDDAIGIR